MVKTKRNGTKMHSFGDGDDDDDDDEMMKIPPGLDEVDDDQEDDGQKSDEEDKRDFVLAMKSALLKKKKRNKRSEASREISEFGLSSGGRDGRSLFIDKMTPALKKVDVKLAEKLTKKLSSRVKSRKETKVLQVPMEKPHAEKIKRSTLYEETSKEMSRWNETVYRNRSADQLIFPLGSNTKLSMSQRATASKADDDDFMPENDFEKEICKILHGEDYLEEKLKSKDQKLNPEIESFNMTMEEALERHNEMAKIRALQSYQITKARRQNKIKSKKYHRLLKREKIRKSLKEFEEMKKKDPEGALEKLEELEKSRVEERMNLKHRNTSKWAKMQSVRAKYNKDARIALSEQLTISKNLTQKMKVEDSSDEEAENLLINDPDLDLPPLVASAMNNPWMVKPTGEIDEKVQMYFSGYKKLWQDINQVKSANRKREENEKEKEKDNKSSTKVGRKKLKVAKKKSSADHNVKDYSVDDSEINQEHDGNTTTTNNNNEVVSIFNPRIELLQKNDRSDSEEDVGEEEENQKKECTLIDPLKFIKLGGKKLKFNFEGGLEDSSDSEDEAEDGQRMAIAEAFEDDDVIVNFQKKKQDEIDQLKPKDIDLNLPGWGDWAGQDIVPKKKKKLIIKAPKGPPRKDAKLSHVIINEKAGESVAEHQVRELPFPYKRVQDFEKIIRAPIGRTWLPELSTKDLIAPKIITRIGQIIQPLDESALENPILKFDQRKKLKALEKTRNVRKKGKK